MLTQRSIWLPLERNLQQQFVGGEYRWISLFQQIHPLRCRVNKVPKKFEIEKRKHTNKLGGKNPFFVDFSILTLLRTNDQYFVSQIPRLREMISYQAGIFIPKFKVTGIIGLEKMINLIKTKEKRESTQWEG